MNAASPSEVTESVTIVDPGCSSNTIAASSAIRRLLRLNATPEASIDRAAVHIGVEDHAEACSRSSRLDRRRHRRGVLGIRRVVRERSRPDPGTATQRRPRRGARSTEVAKNPPEPSSASTRSYPLEGLGPVPTPFVRCAELRAYVGDERRCAPR